MRKLKHYKVQQLYINTRVTETRNRIFIPIITSSLIVVILILTICVRTYGTILNIGTIILPLYKYV